MSEKKKGEEIFMKSKKSLEQGICIVMIIAGHASSDHNLTSEYLSQRLGVSDSYLKKITRQLVLAGLIESNSGKNGGFTLKKKPEKISLYDIFIAIEGKESFVSSTGLVEKVFFHNKTLAHKREKEVLDIFKNAELLYKDYLKTCTLDRFLDDISSYPL